MRRAGAVHDDASGSDARDRGAARRAVFSNPDLVRHIIRQSREGARLLITTKELGQSEDCAPHMLRWARDGCRPPTNDDERRCLDAVGGMSGAFCTDQVVRYEVTRKGKRKRVDAARLAQHLAHRIERGGGLTLVLQVRMATGGEGRLSREGDADGTLHIRRDPWHAGKTNRVVLTMSGGWRRKGRDVCHPTDDQLRGFLHALLTRPSTGGFVQLPCGSDASASAAAPCCFFRMTPGSTVQLLGGKEHHELLGARRL